MTFMQQDFNLLERKIEKERFLSQHTLEEKDDVTKTSVTLNTSGFRYRIKLDYGLKNRFGISAEEFQMCDFLCIAKTKGNYLVALLEFKHNTKRDEAKEQIESGYYLSKFINYHWMNANGLDNAVYIGFVIGKKFANKKFITGPMKKKTDDAMDERIVFLKDKHLPIFRIPSDVQLSPDLALKLLNQRATR